MFVATCIIARTQLEAFSEMVRMMDGPEGASGRGGQTIARLPPIDRSHF